MMEEPPPPKPVDDPNLPEHGDDTEFEPQPVSPADMLNQETADADDTVDNEEDDNE